MRFFGSGSFYWLTFDKVECFFLLTNPQFVLLLQYLYKILFSFFSLEMEDQRTVDTEVQVSFCLYLFPSCDVAKDAWNGFNPHFYCLVVY